MTIPQRPWMGSQRQLVPIEFDSATPTTGAGHAYVVPDGVYEILVDGSAGGWGGGGGHTADPGGGGGGGGPGMAVEGARIIVVPGETLYIYVGGGGLGGAPGADGGQGGETTIRRNNAYNGQYLLRLANNGAAGKTGTATNGGAGGNSTIANGGVTGTGAGAWGFEAKPNIAVNYPGAGGGAGGGPSSAGGRSGRPVDPHGTYSAGGNAVATKGGGGAGAENLPFQTGYRLWGLSNPSTQGGKADVLGSGGVMGAGQDGVVYGTGGGGGAATSPGGNGARGKLRLWV